MSDPVRVDQHAGGDPLAAPAEEATIEHATTHPKEPSSTQAGALGGLIPEDRPELLVGASLAGGVLAAIVLRTLVRR